MHAIWCFQEENFEKHFTIDQGRTSMFKHGGYYWGKIYIPLAGCIARREMPRLATGGSGACPPPENFFK